MKLRLEHRIDAPLDVVEGASNADDFQARLTSLPNVAERSVTSIDRRPDGSINRVVRYRFSGNLPAPVLRAIGGSTISWDEVGTFDPVAHEWRFEIHPHVFKGRFHCQGRYAFIADGDATRRIVEAEVKVRVPLVGGRVERVIADGLSDTMNAEARLLATYLAETQAR